MLAQPQAGLTAEQYLEWDRASEIRNEFYDGRMYPMPGGSHRHAIVTTNIGSELAMALKKQPHLVSTSCVRLRVAPQGLFTYPDVAVVGAVPMYVDQQEDILLNPVLLIEVLSPSTEAYDRGFKSAQYRKLESLQEYALVSQDAPHVEIFRRQASGAWLLSEVSGLEATCQFASVDCSVALAEIYDKVAFDPEQPIPQPA